MCTEGVKFILLRAGKSLDILGIEPAKFSLSLPNQKITTSMDKFNYSR